MSGRKLYDLMCDAWAESPSWERSQTQNTLLREVPRAWPFLSPAERRTLNRTAANATPKSRRRPTSTTSGSAASTKGVRP